MLEQYSIGYKAKEASTAGHYNEQQPCSKYNGMAHALSKVIVHSLFSGLVEVYLQVRESYPNGFYSAPTARLARIPNY